MQTARQLADIVMNLRRDAWDRSDPTEAIVATEKLANVDTNFVRQVVAQAGFVGEELESMTRHVSQLLVGKIEALADGMPATGAD